MMPPLVSCIIPVYNGARFLAEAIGSIQAQTHQRIEIIVVDDGSTDGTAEVATGFGEGVRYLWQENSGPVVARNRGIEASQGEYLAFLDSDDLWVPTRLEKQLTTLFDNPGTDVSVCLIQNFFMPGCEPRTDLERNHPKNGPVPGYLSGGMLLGQVVFDRVGPFDPSLEHGDGAEWFLRARQCGVRDILVDEVLVRRRIHDRNMSRTEAAASRDEFLRLIKRSLDQRRQSKP